ncbi:extracellular solute-binding protein [Opitutus sp. ER46]|uniref:ABC transporter substrate-binding protein n=1 Tax=Opitutus sp. ER46 TaxID=2161864 RepID=UPI000D2FCFE7|nr:extracellular solute-binding protein [Opitutus sp. ER46]PTX91159.1 iron ABC transporter substrate-binding protein [Opitutus sp. ER46]
MAGGNAKGGPGGAGLGRWLIIAALLALLALPFALRPPRGRGAAAQDTVVIISPHNEAIRYEFGRAFPVWYRARTGRTVTIDWRVVGGTSDISRLLETAYVNAFRNAWTGPQGKNWSAEVQATFQSARLPADASAEARAARTAFLASDVSCGIDLFFGGDAYQFDKEARAGRLVDGGMRARQPGWFGEEVIPRVHGGAPFWDADGRWYGVVLSSYGIIFNRDSWRRLGLEREPTQWPDLADARLVGEIGLADPTKSGSVCEAFEAILQQQMQQRLTTLAREAPELSAEGRERRAVREGWTAGLRLIQRLGANARYFTDSSQKPPLDVANGDCAAGLCIDFYGRQQQEATRRRGDQERVGYVTPVAGSAATTDPIGLLRGAPHREVAMRFMEFVLSPEGQKVWSFRVGTPGGPERYALRRMPVRRDFYAHEDWKPWRSDPEDAPYGTSQVFVYRPVWTGALFREIGFITRVLCQDTHAELVAAWRAIQQAPEPARARALSVLQDVAAVDYERAETEIRRRLNARDRVEEVRLASELGAHFRAQYAEARRVAEGR